MSIKKSKGFTLIELMIVVAIIGILAAVAIPKFADLVTKSKEAAVKGNVGSVRSAISIYYGDTEGIHPAGSGLYAGLTNGDKYLPSSQGLGDFTLPKNTSLTTGHSGGKITSQAKIRANSSALDSEADASPLVYDSNNGTTWVNCTHNDTKGSIWSTN